MLPTLSFSTAPGLTHLLRDAAERPLLLPVKHGIRRAQTLLNLTGFRQLRQVATELPLAALLARQPRFCYKYLSPYAVVAWGRAERLAALLHHYRLLADVAGTGFLARLAAAPTLWQAEVGGHAFRITLSFPPLVGFECELSLNFLVNEVPVQVVGLVLVPGQLLGLAAAPALLLSQVQGTRHIGLLKLATRTLHDCTPAALLVHAAYGLAQRLGIGQAAGLSVAQQVGRGADHFFDYDAFWAQFKGQRNGHELYALTMPPPERPLPKIKHNHRARTLRKRQFKQQLREAVAAAVGAIAQPASPAAST